MQEQLKVVIIQNIYQLNIYLQFENCGIDRNMMNMKKIIDETDFDNLTQLTKRWANSQKPVTTAGKQIQKQNDFKKSNQINHVKKEVEPKQFEQPQILVNQQPKPTVPRKNKVVPQVIDEDTQHFKNKLEHLLNNFKTDAVAQFMNMKKQMLDYQQECVKADTHKYLTMYQEKHKQLLETKQKLLQTSRQAEKKTAQVQMLSDHIAKLNDRMKTYKYVSRPFSILYENMVKGKQLKFKMKQAAKFDEKRQKRKSIWGWVGIYKSQKQQKQKAQNQQRIQKQVNDIVGKFQKQMDMLKQRLAQSMRKNQQYESNKHVLQQNLKKAFLRGVCAMNMQAMGVLGTQNAQQNDWTSQKEKTDRQKSMMANNFSYIQTKNPSMSREEATQNQSMYISKPSNKLSNPSIVYQQKSQNILIQPQKSQSKNYKWKQAPIMGVQQNKQVEQPRMQVVRPTTQGKVIKVVQGKSTVQIKKTVPDKTSIAGSRKKI